MKAAVYARVSTLLGQDPELQLITVRQVAANRGYTVTAEYVDKGVSGAKEKRPALDQLISDARHGKFQVLIVTAIDRIGRNTRHLLNLLHELSGYGVAVVSLRENLDLTTAVGQATLTILGAVAQLERDLTAERVKTSIAAKRAQAQKTGRAYRHGRPDKSRDQVARVRELRDTGKSIREIRAALRGQLSVGAIHAILKGETS